ncbi:ABC transporter permease [Sphingomonas jaspsi]|uniref:ABC transporter permease n=1 Tax=Sphingomonas jaspsi TaxID=392409 RepID=UPI0004B4DBA3|nr:ABC transporter permease [Sphingomonas jaspsi]
MNGFLTGFRDAMTEVFTTRSLLSTMVVAVLFYGFYYPAPYRHQGVVDIPVVVVDDEDSAATRTLVRALDDSREVAVVARLADTAAAEQAVRDRRAEGIVHIDDGLTRRLLTGSGTGGVAVTVNGSYLLRARGIAVAVQKAVENVADDQLGPALKSLADRNLPKIEVRPLFNPTTGYADYIFPAVSVIILQQTLLFGAAMLAGRRRADGRLQQRWSCYSGTLAALALIGCFASLFYFGLVFWIEDMPRGGNVPALFVAVPVFSVAVAALGLLIGSFLDEGDRAMELLVPTSVVLFFLTGTAWPTQMMPAWVQVVATLSPATHGVPLFVGLNQMGASLAEVAKPLMGLAALALAYGVAAGWRLSRMPLASPRSGAHQGAAPTIESAP